MHTTNGIKKEIAHNIAKNGKTDKNPMAPFQYVTVK